MNFMEKKTGDEKTVFKWKKAAVHVAHGFSMGTANVIPGVSGGTMALVHGIYEELVNAIRSVNLEFLTCILRFQWKKAFRILHWRFLVPLSIGIMLAVVSLARVVPYLLDRHRAPVCGLFFGLILASSLVLAREIQKWSATTIVSGVLFAAGSFFLVGLLPLETPDSLWFIFVTGVVSFMAMLLPGLSGAFILLILGKYTYILELVQDLVYRGRIETLLPLSVFGAGCIVGILGLARVLGYFLAKRKAETMAALGGLMLGSLRKLWPWREVTAWMEAGDKQIPLEEANRLPSVFNTEVLVSLLLFIAGVGLVFVLERAAGNKKAE